MNDNPQAYQTNNEIRPEIVTAIVAALKAGGYLTPAGQIVGLRRTGAKNPWMPSGLWEIMMGRDFSNLDPSSRQ